MNSDPIRPPETDEEPWVAQPDTEDRGAEWLGLVLLLTVAALAFALGRATA